MIFLSDSAEDKFNQLYLETPFDVSTIVDSGRSIDIPIGTIDDEAGSDETVRGLRAVEIFTGSAGNATHIGSDLRLYSVDSAGKKLYEYHFSGSLLKRIEYQGTHLMYENEYQCTVEEHEFLETLNPSARKIRSNECPDFADFATGSLFRPYVTTIGLYNEHNELLVVGKLGQPIRMSNETDTTFVLRWDT